MLNCFFEDIYFPSEIEHGKEANFFRTEPTIIEGLEFLAVQYDKTLTDLLLEAFRDLQKNR